MAKSKDPKSDAIIGPTTVAVINDDPDACEVVARVLEAAGHTVVRISEPEEVLLRLVADPPSAVVIDMVASPQGAGLAVLETVRKHANEKVRAARVLMIGAEGSSALFTWHSGTDGFLLRPMHANALVTALAELLARPEKDRVPFRTAAHQAELQQSAG